jgi:hypothetical protein
LLYILLTRLIFASYSCHALAEKDFQNLMSR